MKYNYIFAGAGLSTFLVLHEMMQLPDFHLLNIIILENNTLNLNEKTWCFWEKEAGEWNHLVSKKWENAYFQTQKTTIEILQNQFYYKKIDSVDFIKYFQIRIKDLSNVDFIKEKWIKTEENANMVFVYTENNIYESNYFISSVLPDFDFQTNTKFPLLQQHFIGWFIETKTASFDEKEAIFMDFSVEQQKNTRFMYVLPLSATKCLFEYTLFSKDILEEKEYEEAIQNYLHEKNIFEYQIYKKEKGNIPMTAFPFWKKNSKRIIYIGTAGGWTKASTGFTFKNSQNKAKLLVAALQKNNFEAKNWYKTNRFYFYDTLFIEVLYQNNAIGKKVFTAMFEKVNSIKILRFLEEKSTFWEEIQVLFACPKVPFINALIRKFIN